MARNIALKVAIVSSGQKAYVIADKAGIHETLLSKFITGRKEASPQQKKSLARVLKVPVETLFPEVAA